MAARIYSKILSSKSRFHILLTFYLSLFNLTISLQGVFGCLPTPTTIAVVKQNADAIFDLLPQITLTPSPAPQIFSTETSRQENALIMRHLPVPTMTSKKDVLKLEYEKKSTTKSPSSSKLKASTKTLTSRVSRPVLPTRKSFVTLSQKVAQSCNTVTVLAITTIPYNEGNVEGDRNALLRQLSLLESFTGVKMSSFGEYTENAVNEAGQFAERIYFANALGDCSSMQEFARKAVSYSREVYYG
ncbi:secreted clade V proteins domain-containing protein [Ditylenchus destructor]|nr:secreted clade V proteins domain-containing protein [Ditylenchus destructor]